MSVLKRFDPSTAPPVHQKIAAIAGTIFVAATAINNAVIALPEWATTALWVVTAVSGALSGYSVTRVKK